MVATESRAVSMADEWAELFQGRRTEILQTQINELPWVEFEYRIVESFREELGLSLRDEPEETIEVAQGVLDNLNQRWWPEGISAVVPSMAFRLIGLPGTSRIGIRHLRKEHLTRLIAVEGIITRVTEVRPRIKVALFECLRCGENQRVDQEELTLIKPVACDLCAREQNKSTEFKLLKKRSEWENTQRLEIQEAPEGLRGGAQPERLWVMAESELCGRLYPGDRCLLNGFLAVQSRRRGGQEATIYEIVLELHSIEVTDSEFDDVEITEQDERDIIEMSQDPELLHKLTNSIAPTIHRMDMEKQGLLLQLFGGIRKKFENSPNRRGDIHILLIGDPGVAKSQLLRYIALLAPRAVFANGQSTSKAGLTATAVRDSDVDGRFVLEAGVLVIADLGIACIDELDKMNKQDRSAMLDAMEAQTIHVAKAGINATLQTRCSILAAANPKRGRFDPFESVQSQVNLSPVLLSRFDCIFTLTDVPNREQDEQLARFIIDLHDKGQRAHAGLPPSEGSTDFTPPVSVDFMRKYIAYAKRNCKPVFDPEVKDEITRFYVGMRQTDDGSVTITARQEEAVIRLAEASARMRLSSRVEKVDSDLAIDLTNYWLTKVATDPETKQIDLGWVTTGTRQSQIKKEDEVLKQLAQLELETDSGHGVPLETIVDAVKDHGHLNADAVRDILNAACDNGVVYTPKNHHYRRA